MQKPKENGTKKITSVAKEQQQQQQH